jgi:hypothetical protein
VTACRCPTAEAALACRRAGTTMVRLLWELCQRSPEYRALWDGIARGEQPTPKPPPDGKARLRTCAHRQGRLNGTPPGGVPHRRLPPVTRVPP